MASTTAATLATLLTSVGSIVTAAITWSGEVVAFIGSEPLVLMFVLISFVGTGVHLLRRMMRL